MLDLLPVPDDATVLDLGAGTGKLTRVLADRGDVLAFAASVSWIACRDDRERVLAELAAMLPEGEYRFTLRTDVTWTTRR